MATKAPSAAAPNTSSPSTGAPTGAPTTTTEAPTAAPTAAPTTSQPTFSTASPTATTAAPFKKQRKKIQILNAAQPNSVVSSGALVTAAVLAVALWG